MREINNGAQTVFEMVVRAVGFTGQPNVKVTLWKEYEAAYGSIQKGTLVAVDGKYTQGRSADGSKTYHNLSAVNLAVLPTVPRAERDQPQVANATPAAAGGSGELPF